MAYQLYIQDLPSRTLLPGSNFKVQLTRYAYYIRTFPAEHFSMGQYPQPTDSSTSLDNARRHKPVIT